MSEKVKIDKIKPDGSEGDHLKDYYFQQDDHDKLGFYSPGGDGPLNTSPIILGLPFNVTLRDGRSFNVNVTGMSGTWVETAHIAQDPGDGTFQAQAGGAGEEETASSAYA